MSLLETEEVIDPEDDQEQVLDDTAAKIYEQLANSSSIIPSAAAEISYQQGITHLAAAIASNFREEHLGTTEMESKIPSQMFTIGLNKGGLFKPTEKWLADVIKMKTIILKIFS